MLLRTPRHLTLLALIALVAPALTALHAEPAAAARPDAVSPAYVVDEWTDGDPSRLPAEPYARVEVAYDATYGITLDGQVRSALPSWKDQALIAPEFEQPIVDVTGGTTFGMALDDQGHLHTWGTAPAIPADDLTETYRDVAAVGGAAIGLTADGELRYWGDAASQYSFDPDTVAASDIVSIDADLSAAVAVTADGRVLSAGGAINGAWNPEWSFPADRADELVVAADAGVQFAVALTDVGEVIAWGTNNYEEAVVPDFPEGRHAVAVSAGMWMAAAVLDDGSIVRWGQGERTVIPAQRAGLPVVDIDLDRYRSAVTYATLASTSAPTISGTPQFGETLTATPGEWSSTPDEVHYEWRAHDPTGTDSEVVGTDSPTYTPSADDASNDVTLSVVVTAQTAGLVDGSATSGQTESVVQAQFTTAPTLTPTGEPRVGRTLTAAATDAVPVADARQWVWLTVVRGDDPDSFEDDDFSLIEGATSGSLVVTPGLAGRTVVANLIVTKDGYEPTFGHTRDVVIAPGVLAAPTVSVAGKPRVNGTLTAVATAGPGASVSYQWLRGSVPIAGATTQTYRPVAADLGKVLQVQVSTAATGYTTSAATSAATAPVALGATKLKVTVPRKAIVGKKAAITVRGLAAGERFTVTVGAKRIKGTANRAGVGKVKVKITGKPRKRAVKVVGSVADRAGKVTLRVVRRR